MLNLVALYLGGKFHYYLDLEFSAWLSNNISESGLSSQPCILGSTSCAELLTEMA